MSADNFALTTFGTRALEEHLLAVADRRQPIFWIALALAALVHIVALVGIGQSNPHRVGDANGQADAIDVEIVDASALHNKMGLPEDTPSVTATPPSAAAPPPPQEQSPAEPEQEAEQQPPQEQEAPKAEAPPEVEKPEAQEKPKAAPEQPAEEQAPEAAEPAPEKAKEAPAEPKKVEPKPAPKADAQAEPKTKPKPKPQPQKKLSPPKTLDLSVPVDVDGQPSTGADAPKSSGVSRPPGITRSGENDRFGRDVIRALKRTMPAPMGINGRVTIKIVLNQRGNVASVTLVKGSGSRGLDGEVLFAAGQTSYPFPPKGATEVDRTFLVTYIYR